MWLRSSGGEVDSLDMKARVTKTCAGLLRIQNVAQRKGRVAAGASLSPSCSRPYPCHCESSAHCAGLSCPPSKPTLRHPPSKPTLRQRQRSSLPVCLQPQDPEPTSCPKRHTPLFVLDSAPRTGDGTFRRMEPWQLKLGFGFPPGGLHKRQHGQGEVSQWERQLPQSLRV